MLSFSSCINSAVLLPVGFRFHLYLLVVVFAIAPKPKKHSKLELSEIKAVLLSSDNNISALSSISEQVEEEGKLLEF